jgi:hypothetical protein
VPVLVFFNQDKWLECTVQTWRSVNDEAVVLSDSEKLPVLTELGCYDNALEVKLGDCEVSFQVENDCIPGLIDGNKDNSIGRNGQVTDLVGSFEGEYLRFVVFKVDFFDYVVEGGEEDLLLSGGEEDVAGKVSGSEDVGDLEVVEDHGKCVMEYKQLWLDYNKV